MKKFFKDNWFGLVTIILSFSVVFAFIVYKEGLSTLFQILNALDDFYILLAVFFIFVYWLLDGYILFRLTKINYKNLKLRDSLKTAMIGLLYSALTPFAIGGQPMQVFEMSKKDINTGDATSIITIKSILYQMMLTVFSIVALFFVGSIFHEKIKFFAFFVVLGLIMNLLFIAFIVLVAVNKNLSQKIVKGTIYFFHKIKIIKNPEQKFLSLQEQIENFHKSMYLLSNNYKEQSLCCVLTIVELSFYYLITYMIYRSFGYSEASFIVIISAQSIIMMVTAFVPLPGGSGAAEGSFYLLFSMFFKKEILLSAVFIWRFITYYSCIIVGGIVAFFDMFRAKPEQV